MIIRGGGSYPDYDYYDYSQPYANQTWYYCSDPAGYYPYVTQLSVCNAMQHRLAGGSSQLMPSDLTRLFSRQPG